MLDSIARAIVWVIAFLALRPSGRHRAGTVPPALRTSVSRPVVGVSGSTAVQLHPAALLLDTGAPALVRPSAVAHKREEQRLRARRRALWLAIHGVDVGPRVIHGVEVSG